MKGIGNRRALSTCNANNDIDYRYLEILKAMRNAGKLTGRSGGIRLGTAPDINGMPVYTQYKQDKTKMTDRSSYKAFIDPFCLY